MQTETAETTPKSLFEMTEVVEFDDCEILEQITSNLEVHLEEESSYTDATDGIFDAITTLSDEVGGKF